MAAGGAELIVRSTISSCDWFALLLIAVSLTAFQHPAMPVSDALNQPLSGLDVATSGNPDCHPLV